LESHRNCSASRDKKGQENKWIKLPHAGVYPGSLDNYVFGNTTAASNQGVGIRDPAKNETPSQGKPDY
jgi:hypothetical protein